MDEQEFPVYVNVARDDGGTERVRVGSALRSGDGFLLQLGQLSIGASPAPARAAAAAAPRAASASAAASGGMVFPNYGRSKGMPIAGASEGDLEFYANGCRRTLADEGKARWHDKERALLAAIEAEQARQRGGGGASPGAASGGGSRMFDDTPPPNDDDIPF